MGKVRYYRPFGDCARSQTPLGNLLVRWTSGAAIAREGKGESDDNRHLDALAAVRLSRPTVSSPRRMATDHPAASAPTLDAGRPAAPLRSRARLPVREQPLGFEPAGQHGLEQSIGFVNGEALTVDGVLH